MIQHLAKRVRKTSGYVSRLLEMLKWPENVRDMLRQQPGLQTKAEQVVRLQDTARRHPHNPDLLADDTQAPGGEQQPLAERGRPHQPFKLVEKRRGGFDLQVKYRPGKTSRDELIGQLRDVLLRLEGGEE